MCEREELKITERKDNEVSANELNKNACPLALKVYRMNEEVWETYFKVIP